jgi:hypothetical protein
MLQSNPESCYDVVDNVERTASYREVPVACSSPCDNNNNQLATDGVTPTKEDILMGRGNTHKNHPGNIAFQGKHVYHYDLTVIHYNENRTFPLTLLSSTTFNLLPSIYLCRNHQKVSYTIFSY